MNDGLLNVLLLVPIFLFSLCVHEYAHGWVASLRGDSTPALEGRLTLSPFAHADLLGTIILPIFCIYYGLPFFGWAKPVPIDARNLKRGRHDMALVAAAGPAANVILAVLSALMLGALVRLPIQADVVDTMRLFAVVSIQVNLMLALFNLIPIPPLDGFMVLQGFLPRRQADKLLELAPMANYILLFLLISGGLRFLALPAQAGFRFLVGLVS